MIAQAGCSASADLLLTGSPYRGYAYSYPHKTAYRPLDPPVALGPLWAEERRGFACSCTCTSRSAGCGAASATSSRGRGRMRRWSARYLDALRRQAARVARRCRTPRSPASPWAAARRPTWTSTDLEAVLDVAERTMGADLAAIPGSVEVSPETVDAEKLGLLRARGIDRISIGVETFDEAEAAAVSRPQQRRGRRAGPGAHPPIGHARP